MTAIDIPKLIAQKAVSLGGQLWDGGSFPSGDWVVASSFTSQANPETAMQLVFFFVDKTSAKQMHSTFSEYIARDPLPDEIRIVDVLLCDRAGFQSSILK